MSQASSTSILSEALRKKKLVVALFVCLIVESSSIVAVAVPPVLASYWYGNFTYGCASLQAKTTFNESLVRWISLSCPSGPALSLVPGHDFTGAHNPSYTRMYPTFTPPPGLMGLYLYPHGAAFCPQFGGPNDPVGMFPISDRGDVISYEGTPPLDYCAVVKQSTPSIVGFDVQWHVGPSGRSPLNGRILVSVTNATIRIGDSANLTMTVTNKYSFTVTLQFAKDYVWLSPSPTSYFSSFKFNPSNASLAPGASISTIVTVQTSPSQLPGNYEVGMHADVIYGLRFYGDCQCTPSYTGGGAITYLKLVS